MTTTPLTTAVLSVLAEGPASSVEIATTLDRPVKLVSSTIWNLVRRRAVRCTGRRVPYDRSFKQGRARGGKFPFLYERVA